jgi:hypothetical protein
MNADSQAGSSRGAQDAIWNYSVRRPRHSAASDHATGVRWRRLGSVDEREWRGATLLDLSRNGMRLRGEQEVGVGESLEVEIAIESPVRPRSRTRGEVRWTRGDAGSWELALELEQAVEWEVLGELLLSGALDGADRGRPS